MMKKSNLLRTIVTVALLVAIAWFALPEQPVSSPASTESSANALQIEQVSIRDLDGRVAWQGTVDLAPTLKRIEQGRSDAHRGDGGVFENRERSLPSRPSGYYRKYVIRTPGIRHAGPQRLIVGRNGELWYTPDHYRSFIRMPRQADDDERRD